MLQVSVFIALAFSIVIAIFAVQNQEAVTVSFLWFQADRIAVSVLVLISAALGAGIMLLLGAAREVRLRFQRRSLSQQLKAAQKRVQELETQVAAPASLPPASTSSPTGPTAPIAETTPAAPPA